MKPALDDDALAALVGQLADEFTERLNRGEQPDIEEYARRHPEIADLVRQVLPAVQVMRLPEPSNAAGFTIAAPALGDYRIVREIGRGGMGVVYEAEQVSRQRRVALKVLPIGPAVDAGQLARFQREAKTASQLHHTNIVPVYDVGCAQGVNFYAMQFIDGQGLDRLLAEMRTALCHGRSIAEIQDDFAAAQLPIANCQLPIANCPERSTVESPSTFPKPRGWLSSICNLQFAICSLQFLSTQDPRRPYFRLAASLGIQVADALAYAHERGIIHRDIKPSNLILDKQGIVWISDFGLVKCLEDTDSNLTRTGDVLGTARYMSPEQAVGKRQAVDQRSDVYSLGATLYELLTLRPAFDAADPAAVLQQIAFEEPRAPRQLNRAVPRDLETIVLKAMARNARERYPSAAALAADLRRFIAGEPIAARPVGSVERLVKWARRRPAAAALVAVSLLAALTIVIGAVWSNAELRDANLRERRRAAEAEGANRQAQLRAKEADDAKVREQLRAQEAEDRERLARRYLYAAHMNLVQQGWERGHVGRVRTLLAGLKPRPGQEDLRGFEWFYFWRLSHRDRFTLTGHGHVVSAVAVSSCGTVAATASSDRTIKLWEAETGRLIHTFSDHAPVSALVFGPNWQWIVAGAQDGTITTWNWNPDLEVPPQRLRAPAGIASLAISWETKLLAAGCTDGTIRLYDESHREQAVLVGHADKVLSVAFSPDGSTLASGSADKTVRLWDLMTYQPRDLLYGHIAGVRSVAFSPDGMLVASGGDDMVRLWDATNGREAAILKGHTDSVGGVAFSPDGKTLASVSGDTENPLKPGALQFKLNTVRAKPGEVKLWNVATGMERATLKGHAGPVYCAAFSPDGGRLLTGSDDTTAIVWDVAGSEQATLPGHFREVNSLCFSPDGRTLATVSDDAMLKLWDMASGEEKASLKHRSNLKFVVYSPDGRLLATGGGGQLVYLWDAATRRQLAVLRGHKNTIRSIAFSVDGKLLVTGAGDPGNLSRPGEVKLWDEATGQPLFHLSGHSEAVRSVAISPDGKTIASGSDDHTVKLWDATTGKEKATLAGHTDWVRYVAFSHDGKLLASAGNDATVKLWDMAPSPPTPLPQGERGVMPRATLQGHRAGVLIVIFSPDGQTLATGSTDGTIKLWDIVTGEERAVLEGHRGGIRAAAFSRDGMILATGDNDSRVKLWYAAGKD